MNVSIAGSATAFSWPRRLRHEPAGSGRVHYPIMTPRSVLPLPALIIALHLAMLGASPALAQGRIVDEGTLIVTKTGTPARTENFKISRGENGLLTATGQVIAGSERVTSSLTTDSLGTPVRYEFVVKDGSAKALTVSAAARAGRLAASTTNQRGDESMREYPLTAGNSVILESGLFHQLYFLPLGRRVGSMQAIEPRTSHAGPVVLSANGLEPIDVGGRSVTATHYSLANGPVRIEFWLDAAGRLLRASIPSQGLLAAREELPQ